MTDSKRWCRVTGNGVRISNDPFGFVAKSEQAALKKVKAMVTGAHHLTGLCYEAGDGTRVTALSTGRGWVDYVPKEGSDR